MTPTEALWLILAAVILLGVLIAVAINRTTTSPIPRPVIRRRRPIVVTCGECHIALCVEHSVKDASIEDELHHLLVHKAAA